MKRFDRLIAILLQLQTSRLLRAADIADRYGVSERTIYRDMRSLEAAGVPLLAEAGLGYSLDRSYHLPSVHFNPDEAIALLIGVKSMQSHMPGLHGDRAQSAMGKLHSVMSDEQRQTLSQLDQRIAVNGNPRTAATDQSSWYDTVQHALRTRRTAATRYRANHNGVTSERVIEPVGLCHYSGHWHLIDWCQLREAMRDFRLDRILEWQTGSSPCPARPDASLQDYLQKTYFDGEVAQVEIGFARHMAHVVGDARHYHGYVRSAFNEDEEVMTFLTSNREFLGRWLLQFTNIVRVIGDDAMQATIRSLLAELTEAYPVNEK